MQYICDAPGSKTWFRIETEGEAALESDVMGHVVEKHFRQAWEAATSTYRSTSSPFVEQNIGLKAHVQRVMPLFLTLRSAEGDVLVTAMLPPAGRYDPAFRIVIVGPENRTLSIVRPFASWASTSASPLSASGATPMLEWLHPGSKLSVTSVLLPLTTQVAGYWHQKDPPSCGLMQRR
jgi:hypothetical protein